MEEKDETSASKKQESDTITTQLRVPKRLWLLVKHRAVDMNVSANGAVICLLSEVLESPHDPTRNVGFPKE